MLFEAAGLVKEGLIREWSSLTPDEIRSLRTYLLQYVINNPSLSGFVRERIVQVTETLDTRILINQSSKKVYMKVMAIIIKRMSVEDQGADRHEVIAEVKSIITGGNLQMVNFSNPGDCSP